MSKLLIVNINVMKKIYITPSFEEAAVAVENMIAGSFRGQLGTEGMSGEEVMVKEDSRSFWETPAWSEE